MNDFDTFMPLNYRISDWRQLEHCRSNNSRELHIKVTTFVNDFRLNGQRINVIHDTFGTLFSCVVNAKGSLISTDIEGYVHEFTPGQILSELKKYGFNVEYSVKDSITGNQLELLMTLDKLGFDKLRVISVWSAPLGVKENKVHVVAFQIDPLGDWMNSGYSPSIDEYQDAVTNGFAFDITGLSRAKDMNWSWLYGWVASISDIIEEQSTTELG